MNETIRFLESIGYSLSEKTCWPTYSKIIDGIECSCMVAPDGRQTNYFQRKVD